VSSRAAFVFDADRCTGCEACRIACGIENGGGRDTGWRQIVTLNPSRHPALPTEHLSLACNHCEVPACAIGCPADAYSRDAATGAVLLDPSKCIGCRYCSWLCPYDAPKFDDAAGVMTKCTFCAPRLAAGSAPACTAACPTGALSLGTARAGALHAPHAALAETGLGPSLVIIPRRRSAPPPALAIDELIADLPAVDPPPRGKITLRGEWALLLFTLVMPALVAWFTAGAIDAARRPGIPVFLLAAGVALAASVLHLGKPLRAWRAILNVRSSWLSREIVFANGFVAAGAAALALGTSAALDALAVACGFALVFSIDRVYRAVPRAGATLLHSADALPTAVLLVGIAAAAPLVAWPAAALKAVAFGARHRKLTTPAYVRLALLAGALLPIDWRAAFLVALAGEAIDRVAFYRTLEPDTPARVWGGSVESETAAVSRVGVRSLEDRVERRAAF
jgi:Fe-S-cluster-containing dehydrogenase component/DMSO reductase anchor subunit